MAPSMRYLIVRALLFLAPFIVLMIAQVPWWLSLIVSLAFAFAASIVFFPTLRDAAAADLRRMREGRRRDGSGPDDADVEDSALDRPEADATDDGDEPDASARP
ncbi:DUF4229 domain-containing protein [Agrococcus baldri]|uniref:DUF4229 domain-containing protein n=1 Tax=Agrococcus baldri TaxID=153730 RepID=A0AA87UWD9_9MICO|nr:DUF4229 domain-containing protein [Agrococcus baldri]GEK79397.1 hypothetical protein ABA31_07480 [Agrococcus baldri]